MENRRLLLAALLSAAFILVWQALFPPAPPVRPPEAPPEPTATETAAAAPGEAPATDPAAGPAPEAEETSAPVLAFEGEEVAAASEEESVLEDDSARAVFTNLGGQLLSFRSKLDRDDAGEPLELVRRRGKDPYPFALVSGGNRSHRLNAALFVTVADVDERGRRRLTFRHRSERGGAEKVFVLDEHGLIESRVAVEGREDWGLLLGPGVREPGAEELESQFLLRQASYRQGGETETVDPEKQEEDVVLPVSGLRWVALEDNFFLSAAIPEAGVREAIIRPIVQRGEIIAGEPRFFPVGTTFAEGSYPAQMVMLLAGGPEMEVRLFLGAKRYTRLTALPYGLEETVHWGSILGWIARPLYYGLQWIHGRVVANYGWAIVLVTILIRIVFLPLTHHSQKSMGKMQELNPKLQAIRAKFKGKLKDKQGRPNADVHRQMNDEIMAVYRSAGVNPASGCVPVLLQMPVFFAFYRLLSSAVELRRAPWLAWIRDLSLPDPYYVLPVVMAATSFIMQRMMPQPPDPMQRRMMQILPIAFAAFAFAFPSGLVLYWITNNLFSMAQQAWIVRGKKRSAATAPA